MVCLTESSTEVATINTLDAVLVVPEGLLI